MIRRWVTNGRGRQAAAVARGEREGVAAAAAMVVFPPLSVGRRRGIHTWYSISTSGVTRVS